MAKLHSEFIRFAVAGAIGFAVDAGILYAALALGCGPYVGRVISFICAAFATWQINRRITFEANTNVSLWREWCQYLAAMSLGGLCNYAAYAVALHVLPHGAASPLLAVAVGSIAGMFVNFATAKLWVFKAAPQKNLK